MVIRNRPNLKKRLLIIIPIVLAVLLIGGAAWYFLIHKKDSGNQTAAPAEPPPPPEPTAATPTHEFQSQTYGITMQVPTDWKETDDNPKAATLVTQDNDNDITLTLTMSKDPSVVLPCTHVIRNSEDLTYDSPIEGQRQVTKVTLTSKDTNLKTLCSLMITGDYAAVQGAVLAPTSAEFQKLLPEHRIVATFAKISDASAYPDFTTVQKSTRYTELMTALRTLQVK